MCKNLGLHDCLILRPVLFIECLCILCENGVISLLIVITDAEVRRNKKSLQINLIGCRHVNETIGQRFQQVIGHLAVRKNEIAKLGRLLE